MSKYFIKYRMRFKKLSGSMVTEERTFVYSGKAECGVMFDAYCESQQKSGWYLQGAEKLEEGVRK